MSALRCWDPAPDLGAAHTGSPGPSQPCDQQGRVTFSSQTKLVVDTEWVGASPEVTQRCKMAEGRKLCLPFLRWSPVSPTSQRERKALELGEQGESQRLEKPQESPQDVRGSEGPA